MRKTYFLQGASPGLKYLTYQPSITAMERAIKERLFYVQYPTGWKIPPVAGKDVVENELKEFKQLLLDRAYRKHPLEHVDFAMCYHGPRRRRYLIAAQKLKDEGIMREDAYLKFFLKFETYNFSEKPNPSPRGINPRSDKYLVSIGAYLHRIEKITYKHIRDIFGYTVIMKGFNQSERGKMIAQYWSEVDDPVGLPIDASRFEQSVDAPLLEWEHDIYKSFYKGDDKFAKLLSWQLTNLGSARCNDGRLTYKIKGKRMSGDKNTAYGNCLISAAMGYSFMNFVFKIMKYRFVWRFFCDGDDCVLIIPRRVLHTVQKHLPEWYLKLGFRMKVEKPCYILEQVDFCQSRPVFDGESYVMCRNPEKSLSKDSVSKTSLTSDKFFRRWIKAVGECGISVSGGLPVMQHYYNALIRSAGNVKALPRDHPAFKDYTAYKIMGMHRKYKPVSDAVRVSFSLAFGISPSAQESIELFYDNLEINFSKDLNLFLHRPCLPW